MLGNRFQSKSYQGVGPEIVWVGDGAEVCALGYEKDKYQFMKTGQLDVLSLGIRMGLFIPQVDEKGSPRAVVAAYDLNERGELVPLEEKLREEIDIKDISGIQAIQNKWSDYLFRNTGVRSLGADWFPSQLRSYKSLQTRIPEGLLAIFQQLGFSVEVLEEITQKDEKKKSEKDWQSFCQTLGLTPSQTKFFQEAFAKDSGQKFFEVALKGAKLEPFPFKVDLGAPLPTGWHCGEQGLLGLRKKDANSMNPPLLMAHEVAYRALLNACCHPAQRPLFEWCSPERVGLYFGSGIGPHEEHQTMIVDTLEGRPCGAKALANCIANIAAGYISSRLGLSGKISAHVGACETCLGSIADAYWDLKGGRFQVAIAGGFDDTMTASTYNGFTSNMAFTTNEKLVQNLACMMEEGAIENPELQKRLQVRLELAESWAQKLLELEKDYKEGRVDYYTYQKNRFEFREEKRNAFMNLPKEITQFASMPFAKYRSGFVMGVGAGAGFFTTLDFAMEHGLPVRAVLAGVSEMVPDSGGDASASIASLGNGVGEAYERAFLEAKLNYRMPNSPKNPDDSWRELKIEDIGVWFSHGTSTPLNGWGERREIERINQKYHRNPDVPILVTGDKGEVGHRIGGNFPSLVGYVFADNEVLPVGNYLQSGFAPKGRRGFGDPLDELFPTTKIVGRAGVGGGKPVSYTGDYLAVNGAGFGRINTVLIFRRFRFSEIQANEDRGQEILQEYPQKLEKNLAQRERLRERILFGSEPLVR
jgi:3-oxoacyl-(acyl-carrier-protein) synthase